MDNKVVVDAFDFIYITYEDSSDGELSRVKTKPIGDTLTKNDIEYHTTS